MQRNRRLWLSVAVLSSLLGSGLMGPAPVAAQISSPQAVSNLHAEVTPAEAKPGQSFTVIVNLTVQPGMHIQADKPRQDFLIGTELKADPADGIAWQDARFPEPQLQMDPALGTIAQYTGQVRIELPGIIQANAQPGQRPIKLNLRYQACTDKGSCFAPKTVPIEAMLNVIPGQATTEAVPPTATSTGQAAQAPAPGSLPKTPTGAHLPWEPFSGSRLAELTAAGKTVLIDFTADWCPNCKLNELFALDTRQTAELVRRNEVVPLKADFTRQDSEIQNWLGKFSSISVPLTVIVPGDRPTQPILLRDTFRQATLLAALRQAGPSLAPAPSRPGLTLASPITLSEHAAPIWWYLLAGFVGGFVLNFMPCVLPVISIKVLSLLGQAGQSRRRVFGLGLAFSAGMIALFLALGILVTVAGQTWGALFQSTTFLVVMLGVIVAMACSLFGAFTLSVPAAVGDADAAIEGEGYVGSFGKGVLAVLLGTPCSGPLLGSALAWAAAKAAAGRPEVGMLVFVAMGLGMASPFLVLAAKPAWMRYLPRPGAWMETFKQAMGFLLLLTAVYILYLLQDRMLMAVLFSLGVSFAAWLYGRLVQPGRSRSANWVGRGVVVAVVAAIVWASFFAIPAASSAQSPATTPIQAAPLMDNR